MATQRLKRPRDPVSLAKLIGDIATGQIKDESEDNRDAVRVEAGRLGGLIGGKIRAARLSMKQKSKIAKKRPHWLDGKRKGIKA